MSEISYRIQTINFKEMMVKVYVTKDDVRLVDENDIKRVTRFGVYESGIQRSHLIRPGHKTSFPVLPFGLD